jgi:hypothetical protein
LGSHGDAIVNDIAGITLKMILAPGGIGRDNEEILPLFLGYTFDKIEQLRLKEIL